MFARSTNAFRAGILTLLTVLYTASFASAQMPKEILWTHAFDLAARKFGEADFTKETQRFGVEAFKDTNNNLGLYISQVGSLGIAPNASAAKPMEKAKGPEWLTGLDLPARKAGEKEFSKDTKVHAMEVFKDVNADNWIYITEKGLVSTCPVTLKTVSNNKTPKWFHSIDLNVRKGGVKDWKEATKFGIEAYFDGNNNNIVFISETGSIAVVPTEGAPEAVKGGGKAPEWLHGLDLACRKFNEPNFTKDTKRYGIEVFRDETTNCLIFLAENGNITVAKAPKGVKAPTPMVKQPAWRHGLNLKARTYGEAEFSEKTRVWGGEVFRDENLNITLYIAENGSISAIADR